MMGFYYFIIFLVGLNQVLDWFSQIDVLNANKKALSKNKAF
ncbi:hypothetical protein AO373_1657 [Moraxella catarrhalis]|nr:hypothetical protein AO381_1615 [Moraxella catarrhalis]OAV17847.1 hypothetical protein AO373_1657 [Moraxella catarrhalis]